MPTYDYECQECGHTFEAFQKMSDAPLVSCVRCKGKVRRLIGSGAGIIFKGSGFYATDYRKKPVESKPTEGAACPKANDSCGSCPHATP